MLLILIATRSCVEVRFIPSTSMQPTLQVNDRIVIEKLSKYRGDMIERGAIVCFYPPTIEMPDKADLKYDIPHLLGRMTGLPIFPNDPVFIKRIIGLPGDRIEIKASKGVFINGKLLEEPYISEPASYNLGTLGEIGGTNAAGLPINPYPNNMQPLVVPKGQLFVLGDNRNQNEDSHVWGFLPQDRILGRAWVMVYPRMHYMREPDWIRPTTSTGPVLQLPIH